MKPTIVFVCGAWHTTNYFDPLISALSDKGCSSVAVTPRCVNSRPAATSFQPDVDAVKEVIAGLVEKSNDVVLVMHSYGGGVGTEAVGKLVNRNRDYATKIKRLVYLTSLIAAQGQTIIECGAGLGLSQADPNEDGNVILPEVAIQAVYHDVPEPQYSTYTSKLGAMPAAAYNSYLSHYGWEHVPSTYVYAKLDPIIPPPVQEFIVNTTRNRAALSTSRASVAPFSGPLGTFSVEAGHSLMLSKTAEVAEILRRVVEEA